MMRMSEKNENNETTWNLKPWFWLTSKIIKEHLAWCGIKETRGMVLRCWDMLWLWIFSSQSSDESNWNFWTKWRTAGMIHGTWLRHGACHTCLITTIWLHAEHWADPPISAHPLRGLNFWAGLCTPERGQDQVSVLKSEIVEEIGHNCWHLSLLRLRSLAHTRKPEAWQIATNKCIINVECMCEYSVVDLSSLALRIIITPSTVLAIYSNQDYLVILFIISTSACMSTTSRIITFWMYCNLTIYPTD